MFAVEAAKRLLATAPEPRAEHLAPGHETPVAADVEVDGKFDTARDHELEHVRTTLGSNRLRYSMGRNHLFHKSNPLEIEDEAQATINILNKMGYKMMVHKGVLSRPNFSCKGQHRIVIQRIGKDLRIFFSA
ncbi:hypothetical protein BcepSauron_091 [Burkholderia phage BcepSauron]|uniref:Uncharacterized protein n=1 Tax=Burkholderia phage BcepSauron TaxID=2530033 RepID=A0A482MKA9_9CAUD|nr:hypothetical protein H1O17_gp091 [Burkholderia phage BcepSauron]QBQ74471.1 hypothetical protein BcepSauron_091 [Burkholderia phage BcepSauron]